MCDSTQMLCKAVGSLSMWCLGGSPLCWSPCSTHSQAKLNQFADPRLKACIGLLSVVSSCLVSALRSCQELRVDRAAEWEPTSLQSAGGHLVTPLHSWPLLFQHCPFFLVCGAGSQGAGTSSLFSFSLSKSKWFFVLFPVKWVRSQTCPWELQTFWAGTICLTSHTKRHDQT